MPQYKVAAGETLSGIAKKLGLSDYNQLGYKGDPTKLQVGTVLNYGDNSQPAPAAQPAQPAQPAAADTTGDTSMDTYLAAAHAEIDPGFQEMIDSMTQSATDINKSYQSMASGVLNREPLIRQTYANIAKDLEESKKTETTTAQQIGEQNIGGARAGMAAAGIEGGSTGSFATPVTAEQEKLQGNIASIADKYNVKEETLNSQMTQDVSSLQDQANTYLIQGNTQMASAMKEIAQLKYDQQKEVRQTAAQYRTADYQNKQFQMQQDKLDLQIAAANRSAAAAERAASAAEAKTSPGTITRDSSGGLQIKDANGKPISMAAYAKNNDIPIEEVLGQSQQPGDQTALQVITALRQAIINKDKTNAEAEQIIRTEFPALGNVTF